jgi:hypothetical protein
MRWDGKVELPPCMTSRRNSECRRNEFVRSRPKLCRRCEALWRARIEAYLAERTVASGWLVEARSVSVIPLSSDEADTQARHPGAFFGFLSYAVDLARSAASSCLSANGVVRSIAKAVAVGVCVPVATLQKRAREIAVAEALSAKCMRVVPGRPAMHRHLAESLGTRLVPLCERISSGTTAVARSFTTMRTTMRACLRLVLEGPPMQLVFPRAALRLPIGPASVVVFDPFEVHGVLAPGASRMRQTTIRMPRQAPSWDSNSTHARCR